MFRPGAEVPVEDCQGSGPLRELKHHILRVPLVEVDTAGRVVQVHPPR
jgi:hypothetical protein